MTDFRRRKHVFFVYLCGLLHQQVKFLPEFKAYFFFFVSRQNWKKEIENIKKGMVGAKQGPFDNSLKMKVDKALTEDSRFTTHLSIQLLLTPPHTKKKKDNHNYANEGNGKEGQSWKPINYDNNNNNNMDD